jgi:hypothetical protein
MPDRFPRASLTSERLVLRPFETADADDVHAIWNDVEYLRFAPARFPYAGGSLEQAVEWCARTVEQRRLAGAGISFAAVADRRLVSHVGLFGPDWTAMVCEIHYWTGPWARGHGYAAEAARGRPVGRGRAGLQPDHAERRHGQRRLPGGGADGRFPVRRRPAQRVLHPVRTR